MDSVDSEGMTALHHAASLGHSDIVRLLLSKCGADSEADLAHAQNNEFDTPLHLAAMHGHTEVVKILLHGTVSYDIDTAGSLGHSLLHHACIGGHLKLVNQLITEHRASVDARDQKNNTPLHVAAIHGREDVVLTLLDKDMHNINAKGSLGRSLLHCACIGGNLNLVRMLIENQPFLSAAHTSYSDKVAEVGFPVHVATDFKFEYQADINIRDDENNTPLHVAAIYGREDAVLALLDHDMCNLNANGGSGRSLLHCACIGGNLNLVKTLICKFKAYINDTDNDGNHPLHLAALNGKSEVITALVDKYGCNIDVSGGLGRSALHFACIEGNANLVGILTTKHGASINAYDDEGNSPLHVAAICSREDVVLALLNQNTSNIHTKGCLGRSLLHSACIGGNVDLVRILIQDWPLSINAQDDDGNTPLHVAALHGKAEVALALINEFHCDPLVKGDNGRSVLHSACIGSYLSQLQKHCKKLTSVHIAGEMASAQNFSNHVSGTNDLPPLMACESGLSLVNQIIDKMSVLEVDDNGDTPLHLCSALGSVECLQILLSHNAPITIKNNLGSTPRDVATNNCAKLLLDRFSGDHGYPHYGRILECARNKYSGTEECITRVFVVGDCGSGKSSLVASLSSDTDIPGQSPSEFLHTAGIIPSILKSKDYGRVQFYDFAGHSEYYSSQAAVLENLVSSDRGENLFFVVADLQNSNLESSLNYWLSFVSIHTFHFQQQARSNVLFIGTHLDKISNEKKDESIQVIESAHPGLKSYCLVNCHNRNQVAEVWENMSFIMKKSPYYKLSFRATILLGLLEKDFSSATAISVSSLESYVADIGMLLSTKIQSLLSILRELHDFGLLYIINYRKTGTGSLRIVLDTAKLTNEVQRSLFSNEARSKFMKSCSSASYGIIPESLLKDIFPDIQLVKCLIDLLYCVKIGHTGYFFFPALISTKKNETSLWKFEENYIIGFLTRCSEPFEYFPPRFLHVLLLRLTFKFNLFNNQISSLHWSFFQHGCAVWKTGICWMSEDGVECVVELIKDNREIVATVKSAHENHFYMLCRIISCIIEVKAQFYSSIKLYYFILDPTSDDTKFDEDCQFDIADVERALIHPQENRVVFSASRKRIMRSIQFIYMHKLTHWHSLFPIHFSQVVYHLKEVSTEVYDLSLELRIPLYPHLLKNMYADEPTSISRSKNALVSEWMRSSLEPQCWWHLVKALASRRVGRRDIARKIKENFGRFSIL